MSTRRLFIQRLFLRHRRDLTAFVTRRVGAAEPEDVVQAAYLHLLEHNRLEAIRDPRAFLFTVAANLARDDLRKQQTRDLFLEAGRDLESLPSPAPAPEATVDGLVRLKRLQQSLSEVPALCRDAFLLNRYDGLTHAQIAARLGLSKKTVERYILRAASHCLAALRDESMVEG